MDSAKAIGLMGGSFDPVHQGHIEIAYSFLQSNLIDELWVLLTPESPHKTHRQPEDYSHRLEMLKIAFKEVPKTVVSNFEQGLPTPSYTIQTIFALKEEYPNKHFYLCLGEDALSGFKSWHQWKEILNQVPLLVASRPNFEIDDKELVQKAHFVDHKNVDVSSTEVKERIYNRVDVEGLIPDSVLSYIQRYNLYTS